MNVRLVVRRVKGSLPSDGEVEERAAPKRPMRASSGRRLLAYMARDLPPFTHRYNDC